MPYLMDTGARVAELVDATVYLIASEGVSGVTIRKLAGVLRCSPSTITSHLESKGRIVHLLTQTLGHRMVEYVDRRARRRGIDALVPADDHVPIARAWLAMGELARGSEVASGGVAVVSRDLRRALAWACALDPTDEVAADAVMVATVGVWWAMCARSDPMEHDRARAVLRRLCLAAGAAPESVA